MKKTVIAFLLIFSAQSFAYMQARGLQNNNESWSYFGTSGFSVECESFFGFTRHTIECSYQMVQRRGSTPTGQPFEVTWVLSLPQDAVVTEAYFKPENTWIKAEPENVLDAEDKYNNSNYINPRFLMRELVSRNYYGNQTKTHQLNFGPIYYPNTFSVKITFITQNTIDINSMRGWIYTREFLLNNDYSNVNYTIKFRDIEYPNSKPETDEWPSEYIKWSNNWWTWGGQFNSSNSWRRDFEIKWQRPYSTDPEVHFFKTDKDNFYHTLMLPPVSTTDRLEKKILLLYDLGTEVGYYHTREELINKYKTITALTLSPTDSINMIFIDGFAPKTLYPSFVSATQANISAMFTKVATLNSVQISGLPQLLRASKDYFNSAKTNGELWVLSNAVKHCNPPETANEIMDLSYYQLKYPVKHSFMDCRSSYRTNYLYINGTVYYGNEYLYQNLARMSSGGMIVTTNITPANLELEIAEVFAPAADLVKLEMVPSGGYSFTKYDLNDGKTHYPITYPLQEMGRFEGDLPLEAVFYGQVDGETLRKSISNIDTIRTSHNKYISQIYYARYLLDLLEQPQSFATIEKIAQFSKENNILSPYCGFVVPAPSGYKGFKRLTEVDTTYYQSEGQPIEENVEVPLDFNMQAFPNPFNSRVTVQFNLPPASYDRDMNIRIIDILGRIVREFSYNMPKEEYQLNIHWDGTNNQGLPVSTGLYLVQCSMGDINETVKITYLR